MNNKKYQIGVIGSAGARDYNNCGGANSEMMATALKIGALLAQKGAIVVTGGKDGIMESAAKGAKSYGGYTVGVVKGGKRFTSNMYTDIEVMSGMESEGLDELLLINMCDGVIAIGGGAGTMQEIAIAYRNKKPITALITEDGWSKKLADTYLDDRRKTYIESARTAEQAVSKILLTLDALYD